MPALENFSRIKIMSDPARYALEDISDPAADAALLRALDKTSGPLRMGIISSLGFRKTAEAAGALGKILAAKTKPKRSPRRIPSDASGGRRSPAPSFKRSNRPTL